MKIIGRPLSEIEIDPKWSFQLVEKDDVVYFGVETIQGPRLLPQELILGAFFKAMKSRAISILEADIQDIHLQTWNKLTESQEAVFKSAASKMALNIISFDTPIDAYFS